MPFDLDSVVTLLARTPRVLEAWLRGVPDDWARCHEGPGTWSPFDVVGHLIHGEETDWVPRARIILEHGEARAFDPFDRQAMFARFENRTLGELLDLFATRRADNLTALRAMRVTPADLARAGRHPELGRVTLEQLLSTWVVHDLAHIRQIARVMAKQYRTQVGPWAAFLPVLDE